MCFSASNSYGVCIRQEEGYCCIQYTPCSDSNSYSLDSSQATMAKQDDMCTADYVGIAGESFFWKLERLLTLKS